MRYRYDGENNLREDVDEVGDVTRTEVAHFDLVAAETRPDGSRLQFDYDSELRLTGVTNENGRVWHYEYDAGGNLVRETDFNGCTVAYRYDAAGQLIERTDASGQSTSYVRNLIGDVVERRTPDGTTTFGYDEVGRLVTAANGHTEVRLRYDAGSRVVEETVNGRTIQSTYDVLGRCVRRVTPSGAESRWEYNAIGQPLALHAAGRTLRFDYDAAGHEVARSLGTAATLTQAWSADHELLAQHITGATGAPVQQRSYRYRPDGQLTGINESSTGARSFDLDRLGRITAVRAAGWTERYAYDAAGNITEASWPTPYGSVQADYVGPREISGTLVRSAGSVRYEHDAQGRVVARQQRRLSGKLVTWRYLWDAEDRLSEVRTPDGTRWRYLYDPFGRRTAKRRLDPDGRVVEQVEFSWDGFLLAEQVHTAGGAHDTASARTTVWDYEPDTFRPLAQRERAPLRQAPQQWFDERFFAIVTDLAGSPAELVDDRGAIAWFHRTTLWGNPLGHGRTDADTPLRFPGQYADAETGLNYNVMRHYDPAIGSYLSSDPLGLAAGPNSHRYVANPHLWIDPLGLTPDSCRYVYRNLSPGDKRRLNLGMGLKAKRPIDSDNRNPTAHVLHGSRIRTRYISTTRSADVARRYYNRDNGLVRIDLDKFDGRVLDLSTREGRDQHLNGVMAKNYAKASEEVLLVGEIPRNAITRIRPR